MKRILRARVSDDVCASVRVSVLSPQRGARSAELTRKRGVAPAGVPAFGVHGASVTLRERHQCDAALRLSRSSSRRVHCCCGAARPCACAVSNAGSNTAVDYFRFVVANAIAVRFLVRGDILILDNASQPHGT